MGWRSPASIFFPKMNLSVIAETVCARFNSSTQVSLALLNFLHLEGVPIKLPTPSLPTIEFLAAMELDKFSQVDKFNRAILSLLVHQRVSVFLHAWVSKSLFPVVM